MEHNPSSMAAHQNNAMKVRIRGTAVCAALAGAFLTTFAVFMSFLPEGAPDGPYRDPGMLYGLFFFPSVLLTSASAVGIYFLHRFEGNPAKVVRIAALIGAVSFLFGTAIVIFAWYVGVLLVYVAIFAFVVTGIGLLQARTLPAWIGGVLALASVLLLGFNTEDSRVLFLVPFGLAWITLASLLFAGRFAVPAVDETGEAAGTVNPATISWYRRHYPRGVFHAGR